MRPASMPTFAANIRAISSMMNEPVGAGFFETVSIRSQPSALRVRLFVKKET